MWRGSTDLFPVCVIALFALLGLACSPDNKELDRNFFLDVYAGSSIVVFQGSSEEEASLVVAGSLTYFEDISDLVLGQALVSLSADGAEVAAQECAAVFREVPAGETGRVEIDIECAFTNASVDALCADNQAGIQVLLRSNLGDYQGPVEELDVQCFEDRRMPEILALVSQGAPADKPCKTTDDYLEERFGYQDGLILFVDEYQDDVFFGRRAYYHNGDGTLSQRIAVDADGWWYQKRSYEYAAGVLVSTTTETYPELPYSCSYSFTNGDTAWSVTCDGDSATTLWDPAAKTLVRDLDGVEFTLTYSGTLGSPTEWFAQHWADYINAMHPLDDSGVHNNQAIVTTYVYDGSDRLSEVTSSMDGQTIGTITYAYDCQ